MTIPSYLAVPFFINEQYLDFLVPCVDELDSLHIYLPHICSGIYQKQGECAAIPHLLLQGLERLPGPQKYLLVPQRLRDLRLSSGQGCIRSILFLLEQAHERGQLHGIIYNDHHVLQCLANYAPPGFAARLEAIPGAGYPLDTVEKVEMQFAYIRATGFRLPSRIAIDSSLNRNLDRLAELCLALHQRYPDIKIETLANEGCLFHCPYRLSQENCPVFFHEEEREAGLQQLSDRFGCIHFLENHPHKILQSPFIRPEDIELYLYHVDVIRLSGRMLGSHGLMHVIQAYQKRRHEGNLLGLLDAASWLAERFYIENSLLSFDFTSILSQCDNRCNQCGFCKEVFDSIASPLFRPLEDKRLEN